MDLPFTQDQFFEVFMAYNVAVWPMQVALNVLAIVLVVLVLGAPRLAGHPVSYALALFRSARKVASLPLSLPAEREQG